MPCQGDFLSKLDTVHERGAYFSCANSIVGWVSSVSVLEGVGGVARCPFPWVQKSVFMGSGPHCLGLTLVESSVLGLLETVCWSMLCEEEWKMWSPGMAAHSGNSGEMCREGPCTFPLLTWPALPVEPQAEKEPRQHGCESDVDFSQHCNASFQTLAHFYV